MGFSCQEFSNVLLSVCGAHIALGLPVAERHFDLSKYTFNPTGPPLIQPLNSRCLPFPDFRLLKYSLASVPTNPAAE